jgi:hypothetical protein
MTVVEEPTRVVEPPDGEPPYFDPEALIAEARRRQRKRRAALALIAAALVAGGLAVFLSLSHTSTRPPASGVAAEFDKPTTLRLRLRGFGTPLPTQIDQGPCPQGRTLIEIRPSGSVVGCVRTIRKLDASHYGVKRITQTARETYHLSRGTIRTLETQTIHFARDQRHTTAVFRGRVVGGSGRYAHARGTVTGGGPGIDGHADWLLSLRLNFG